MSSNDSIRNRTLPRASSPASTVRESPYDMRESSSLPARSSPPHHFPSSSVLPTDEPSAFGPVLEPLRPGLLDTLETIQVTQEAPWDNAGETLLRDWLASTKQQAAVHRAHGFRLKRLYRLFGVCSIVSASLVFLLSNVTLLDKDSQSVLVVLVTSINLIFANVVSFFNFGPKYQRHFEFEGRYSKLTVDIEELLVTDREYRVPKDRTLAEYKEKVGHLYCIAPET